MDAWLIGLLSSLYASLLLLVHQDPIFVTLWAVGVPLLALLLRRLPARPRQPRTEPETPTVANQRTAKARRGGRPA